MSIPPSVDVLVERLNGMDLANKLAYTELQRRLTELNHAHEEMVRDKAAFLPREVHEQFFNEYRAWRDTLRTELEKYMPRAQFDQFFSDFGHWRDGVNRKQSEHEGSMTNTRLWMAVITLVLLGIGVVEKFWHP